MDGRAVAFTAVYEAEAGRLRSFLRSKLSSEAAADDIGQEAWTRLWEHWDEVGPKHAAAWAWKTARNLLVDGYRQAGRTVSFTWWVQPDDGWRERAEAGTDLARWWSDLTGEQQQVLLMHFGEDLTYPQIAARLGVDEVALRRRAQRGWQGLRRRIAGRKRWAREGR